MKLILDPDSRERLLSRARMFLSGNRLHPFVDELVLVDSTSEDSARRAEEFVNAYMKFDAGGIFELILQNDHNQVIGKLSLEDTHLKDVTDLTKDEKRARVSHSFIELQNFAELEFPKKSKDKPVPADIRRYFNGVTFQESQAVPTVLQTQYENTQHMLVTA